jgi:hypothetical protein
VAAVVWVFIVVVRDLFRNRELSGWAKAGWLVVLILVPLLGSLASSSGACGWGRSWGTADDAPARAQLSRTEFDRHHHAVSDSTGTGSEGPT